MRQRFAPFLVLLEARYAPLLFAVGPQAYAIYLWLFPVPYALTGEFFAIIGALGYEFIYVGAIAWAEEGKAGRWTWATAAVALVFSVAVAIFVYQAQGWWSVLHAGFPLVAFGYTMQLHGMAKREQSSAVVSTAQTALEPASERLGATEADEVGTDAPRQIQAVGQAPSLTLVLNNNPAASTPLEVVSVEEAHRYSCPHCGQALTSKQALGAAVKNGYCLGCKRRTA